LFVGPHSKDPEEEMKRLQERKKKRPGGDEGGDGPGFGTNGQQKLLRKKVAKGGHKTEKEAKH